MQVNEGKESNEGTIKQKKLLKSIMVEVRALKEDANKGFTR